MRLHKQDMPPKMMTLCIGGGLEKDRASITDARQYVSFYLHMNINNQQG